jgi:putative transposase
LSQQSAARAIMTPDRIMNRRNGRSADVPVGTADEKANENANGKAMNDPTSKSHSHCEDANEDLGVPGANVDVGVPEWYSRGYLPHRDCAHLLQSITFRLADSLPQLELIQLEQKLLLLPEVRRDIEKRKRIEHWLDAGMGCCALRNPEAAAFVQNALLHFDGDRYRILAWVIMPNHVHALIDPQEPVSKSIQGWKSFTARWLLKHNERLGLGIPDPHHVWMREYWDRFIHDDDHLRAVIDYIHHNPVKAGLCREPADWPWSSASRVTSGSTDVPVGTADEKANENANKRDSE